MNTTWIALAALAAFVAYMIVGGIFFMVPAFKVEFAKFPAVYRTGDAINSVMAVGMLGTLIAIATAATLFAALHPTGADVVSGIKFGALLAVFQLGSFVLHNYMMLNISGRLSAMQGVVYSAEWIAVGAAISLVYHG